MKNYSEMSDSEINKAVAFALGSRIVKSGFNTDYYWYEYGFIHLAPMGPVENFDPCKSWADAGPIIEANEISLNSVYEGGPCWLSFAGDDGETVHTDTSPLRAAMIVFLMMEESK